MVDIRQTDPKNWVYVSEGGATIVFSYSGPQHPDFSGTVLRLRKSTSGLYDPPKTKDVGKDGDRDDPIIEFQAKCLQKLLPTQYLPNLRAVHLEKVWLKDLADLQNAIRPQNRRETDEIDLTRTKGVLATDLVSGDCLAVEIKPKWAFLPSSIHLSKETKSVKTRTCRFCMHSSLKVHRGQEAAIDYCPLDLFSGEQDRIRNAISGLWNAWISSNGTINNLKIFARGKAVSPSEAWQILGDAAPDEPDLDSIRRAFTTAVIRPLLATPLLTILSRLQRELDPLDIEGLSKLWRKASLTRAAGEFPSVFPPDRMDEECTALDEPSISDWNDFLDKYMSRDGLGLDYANPSPEHLKYYILSYLLSATFKDCSIFLRLDLLDLSRSCRSDGRPASVTVIDLEPKSVKKLSMWEKLDREITQTYASQVAVGERKVCIDAGLPRLP